MKPLALVATVAVLALLPAAAFACQGMTPMKSSSACPAGQVWNAATQSCNGPTTS